MVTNVTGIATDFITFSRASNATVTNNVGLIAWAPHNFLLASEQLDATNWFKGGITISANSAVAPNGTTTADTCTTTTTTPAIYYAIAAPASTLTYSIYVKTGAGVTKPTLEFLMRNNSTSTNFDTGTFDTVTGAITGTGWTSTAVGSGWYLVSYTRSTGITEGNTLYVYAGWTGATTSIGQTWVIWGAALYRSDLAGMQPNASTNPAFSYYNSTTPKNLLGYTEDLSNAAWVRDGILAFGSGSFSNIETAPNGLQTADLIAEDTVNGSHLSYQLINLTTGGTRYTVSAYLKAAGRSYAMLRIGGGGYSVNTPPAVRFSLFGGGSATVLSTGSTVISSSIEALANGWYRCSVVFTSAPNNAGHAVNVGPHDGGSTITYAGNGSGSVYVWGVQLSDSASIDAYSPNYFAAPSSAAYYGPRRDFSPTTLACNGLLVEEQRTNLALYSGDFTNATWTKDLCSYTGTKLIPNNATLLTSAFLRQDITKPGTSAAYTLYVDASVAEYNRVIVFIQDAENSLNRAQTTVSLVDGTITAAASANGTFSNASAVVTRISTGYRTALTFTTGTETSLRIRIYASDAVVTTGDGVSGINVFRSQLEAGSFATSYIPTSASTVTRSADVASVAAQAFPDSATEGTLIACGFMSVNGRFAGLYNTSANQIEILQNNATDVTGFVYTSGSTQANLTRTANAFTTHKLALAFKENDVAFCANGGTVTTDTVAVIPSTTTLTFNSYAGLVLGSGWIRQVTYIPRRISNTDLQTRTT